MLQMSVSKPQCKKWNEDTMVTTISAVRKKEIGLKKAIKTHNVPRSTLQKYVNYTSLDPKEAVE